MSSNLLIAAAAGLIGACAGSFATTAALRSLRGEQALSGRSRCDGCGGPLGLAATVPVISYAVLRGACGRCGDRIDPAHPVGEVAGALIVGTAFWLVEPERAALIGLLGLVLLAAAIIDQRTQRLPDPLTLAASLLALALATLNDRLLEGLAAAALAFALLEGLRRGFEILRRKPGLGFGDVKLIAALALWLGAATPWALALASIAGLLTVLVAKPSNGRIAFGPLVVGSSLIVGLAADGRLLPASDLFA